MSAENRNRIPADEGHSFTSWLLPEVETGKLVDSAEQSRIREARVEDVELPDPSQLQAVSVEELERITNDAYEEGHRSGMERGLEEGRLRGYDEGKKLAEDESRQILNRQIATLQGIMAQLYEPIRSREAELEAIFIDLLKQAARAVVKHELRQDAETLHLVASEALAQLPVTAREVTIYLHPDDVALVQSDLPLRQGWQLQPDPKLTAGGCRVESVHSRVDATVETRLKQVLEELEARKEHGTPEIDPVLDASER